MTTSTTAAVTMTSKTSSKSTKTKVIILRLSSKQLAKFPGSPASSTLAQSTPSSTSAPTPSDPNATQSPAATSSDPNAAATSSGTATNGLLAPPQNASAKRKSVPGPKPGIKRTNSQLNIDGPPKPRGKPGPKKKPRIGENGAVISTGAAPTAPKLGPKANQGAINACLRALDRTGKPCRKWQKGGFKVKSFTGVSWAAKAWATRPKPPMEFAGDVKSDSSLSGENKPTQESSVVASEKSNSGADTATPMPMADVTSSPAPTQFIAVNPA